MFAGWNENMFVIYLLGQIYLSYANKDPYFIFREEFHEKQ